MTLLTESFILNVAELLIWLWNTFTCSNSAKNKGKLRNKTRNMLNIIKGNTKDTTTSDHILHFILLYFIFLVFSRFRDLVYWFTSKGFLIFFHMQQQISSCFTICSSYIACIATNGLLLWKLRNSFKSVHVYTACEWFSRVQLQPATNNLP